MEIGMNTVVLSLAGRDKGRIFAVTAPPENGYAAVADGRLRSLQKPKKKKFRHLRVLGTLQEPYSTNRELHRALSRFAENREPKPEGGNQLVEG